MTADIRLVVALALCAIAACAPTTSSHSDFAVGAPKSELLQQFGEPADRRTIRKDSEAIWGAIETFWTDVPMGSTVEIWTYDSADQSMGNGQTELYFIDGSALVGGIGFSPAGVVFESEPGG